MCIRDRCVAALVPVHRTLSLFPNTYRFFDPSSLRIRCPIRSERAKTITKNAERRFVNERLRLINGKPSWLNENYDYAIDVVNRTLHVPIDLAQKVQEHVKAIQDNEFQKMKKRHQDKFARFLEMKVCQDKVVRQEASEEQYKRWVIKLSQTVT